MLGDILPESATKHAGHGGSELMFGTYKEIYNVYEMRGRMFIGQRFYVLGMLPYVNNYRSINGQTQYDVSGIGDPMAMANYQLFNTKCYEDSIRFIHRLTVGAGVKAPMGRTDIVVDGETPDLDMQPGSGSWDILFSLEYILRYNKTGGNLNLVYRKNTANPEGYQYGDASSLRLDLFHMIETKSVTIMPSIGVYTEYTDPDVTDSEKVNGTGGYSAFATIGAKVFIKNVVLHGLYQRAVHNDVGMLQVPNYDRLIVGLTYNFN